MSDEETLKVIAYTDPDRTHAAALVNIARAALGLPLLPPITLSRLEELAVAAAKRQMGPFIRENH